MRFFVAGEKKVLFLQRELEEQKQQFEHNN